MFKRARYQSGCLTREKRSSGPDVWIFRYREHDTHRKLILGTVQEFPTKAAASREAERHRVTINNENYSPRTVAQLATHYEEKELAENGNKAYSTRAVYRIYLNNWIVPKWGEYPLREVKTVAVEAWLGSLTLAPGTKAKLRNLLSALFRHAQRYEWTDRNPISLVRQSAKRQNIPSVLTVEEIKALLSEIGEPYRTITLLAASTGLRASELLGLQWADIDFQTLEMSLTRGVVHQVVGGMKTEASRKPVSLTPEVADALRQWKEQTPYNQSADWVFASPEMKGKQPLWPENILRRYIRPAAVRAGIQKRIGFHTFRHSFGTLLKANGADVKTVQELLRHANSRITLDTYVQAVTPAKRQAQSNVVTMILPSKNAGLAAVGG